MSFFFALKKMENFGRDITLTEITGELILATACDSCGGAGGKELDVVKVPPELVGQLTTRVALMELLCAGVKPSVVTVAISSEPEPTGNRILEGVKHELGRSGFEKIDLVISTEKNIETRQTGLGIGISGVVRKKDLLLGLSREGDHVYCLGKPIVGEEVVNADKSIMVSAEDISLLRADPDIHDILPVGSRGINGEIIQFSKAMKLDFIKLEQHPIDLNKSAGPSSCLLFTCANKTQPDELNGKPLTRIGFISKS